MVERHRREETPQTPVALDDKGRALELLLPQVLAEFRPEIGASIDLVVVAVKPQDVPAVCRLAKEDPRLSFDYLMCLCVVDYVEHLQVVYHFNITVTHSSDSHEGNLP